MQRHHARLETFLSLNWYEVALRFLFTFVAKTSEVLLAAGLVVSTANFLTDGSILTTYPGVSIAWAWAQALAIDSSLGVSLSYAFQCITQEAWIRGMLYGLLTVLLATVAGGITTIDIVSHALHLSMNDAMVQMGINVMILSRLRAIAVIGFILMSRLRDLPVTTLMTMTPKPQRPVAPVGGLSQEQRIQAVIQSLGSQFSAEELAHILNACIATKKLVLARVTPKGILEPQQQPTMDQHLRQGDPSEHVSEPVGSRATQEEPEPAPIAPGQSDLEPIASREPVRKAPAATEPSVAVEQQRVPEPIAGVPSKKLVLEQVPLREPQNGGGAPLEPDGAPPLQRLEQAYQSLIAEGKKPSGRTLAERAHVHRSTCVEWLKGRQQQAPEMTRSLEEPERDDLSLPAESPGVAMMELPGKALGDEIASLLAELPEPAMMPLREMEMALHEAAGSVSPNVFPDSLLPEDRPAV